MVVLCFSYVVGAVRCRASATFEPSGGDGSGGGGCLMVAGSLHASCGCGLVDVVRRIGVVVVSPSVVPVGRFCGLVALHASVWRLGYCGATSR